MYYHFNPTVLYNNVVYF